MTTQTHPALRFSRVPSKVQRTPELQALHDAMRLADGVWRAAHKHGADDDLVRTFAQQYIDASRAFQRARFGRVRVRQSVIGLLREVQLHQRG